MGPIRDEIAGLEMSGIAKVAAGALHDPDVIPLWFGESDLVTAGFICDAAKSALDEGRTFYNYPRGILPLREALQGDLAESWREQGRDYVTVAMRFGLRGWTTDNATGRVVEGSPDRPVEATELWTFVRPRTGQWRLSAIQQG